jgi:exodeoxyribonuclease VII small subunit
MASPKKNTPEPASAAMPSGFDPALAELRQIVDALAQSDVSIDSLTQRIQRAQVLLQYCQSQLSSTREEVQQMLSQLGLGEEGAGAS